MSGFFGQSLRKLRKDRGLTQEQLAQRLHVTRQTVSYWENGRTQPDYETLARIAAELQVPVAALLEEQTDGGEASPVEPGAREAQPAASAPDTTPPTPRSARLQKRTVRIAVALLLLVLLIAGLSLMRKPAGGEFTIEQFTQAQSPQEGQAFLTISTRETPVQAIRGRPGTDAYWRYSVLVRETNGVGITLVRITYVTFYRSGRTSSVAYVTDILRENVGATTIGPNEIRLIQTMEPADRNTLGMGILIEGTDEHGNPLSFRQYIPYAYTLD